MYIRVAAEEQLRGVRTRRLRFQAFQGQLAGEVELRIHFFLATTPVPLFCWDICAPFSGLKTVAASSHSL